MGLNTAVSGWFPVTLRLVEFFLGALPETTLPEEEETEANRGRSPRKHHSFRPQYIERMHQRQKIYLDLAPPSQTRVECGPATAQLLGLLVYSVTLSSKILSSSRK